jgi:hypothetical protein
MGATATAPPATSTVQRYEYIPLLTFTQSDLVHIEPLMPLPDLRQLNRCQPVCIAARPVGNRYDMTLSATGIGAFATLAGYRGYPSIEFIQHQQSALLWEFNLRDPYRLELLFPKPDGGVPNVTGGACNVPLGMRVRTFLFRRTIFG